MTQLLSKAFHTLLPLIVAVSLLGFSVADEPYVPDGDEVVLEVLPEFLVGGREQFVEIREHLRKDPTDEVFAGRAAKMFIHAGEEYSDPRFLGLARTMIEPWWTSKSVPAPILMIRAKLKEKKQLYDEATIDLIKANSQQPKNGQSLIELAKIYSWQGQYGDARTAIQQLKDAVGDVIYQVFLIPIDARTGHLKAALERIDMISPDVEARYSKAVIWLIRWKAELAEISGNFDQADEIYRHGLDQIPDNIVTKLAYADFLIQRNDCESVIDMFPGRLGENRILLRVAIAAKKTGRAELADQYTQELKSRFEAIRQRGDRPDQAINARFYLDLADKPELALERALENWGKRKGLGDSRLVLRSALAANRPWDARGVKRFLHKARTEDVISQRLISKLESLK